MQVPWWAYPLAGPPYAFYCQANAAKFTKPEFPTLNPPQQYSGLTAPGTITRTFGGCTATEFRNGIGDICVAWGCVPDPTPEWYDMRGVCPHGWYFLGGPEPRCECHDTQQLRRGADGKWTCQNKCSGSLLDRPDCSRHDQSCPAGNPVQPGIASKVQTEVDYEGAGAHALSFTRTFRSMGTPEYVPPGGWRQWTHNWAARIDVYPKPGRPGRAWVIRGDGSQRPYDSADGSINWQAWQVGDRNRLLEDRDSTGQRTGFRYLVWADDSVEHYSPEGQLLRIVQRNGWTTTLGYSTAATPAAIAPRAGLLISVRNHFGRELRLTYDAAARLVELLPPGAQSGAAAGSASSPIRYGYAEPQSLGAGVTPADQLSSVTWQDGHQRRYHYEYAERPSLMTGITDELGVRIGTYSYLSSGRVYRTEGPGGARVMTISAGQTSTSITDYSAATPVTTTYTWQEAQGVIRPIAVSAPCPLCGSSSASTVYTATGEAARSVGHDGRITFFSYDAKGRETERAVFAAAYNTATTRPVLSVAESVITTRWHPLWNVPLQRAEPGSIQWWIYDNQGALLSERRQATTDPNGAKGLAPIRTGDATGRNFTYGVTGLRATTAEVVNLNVTSSWSYTYNATGDPTQLSATEAGITATAELGSTAQGQLSRIAASNGALAAYGYAARGGLVNAQLPDLNLSITRDARSLPTRIDTSAGTWLRIDYDAAGVPTQVTDSSGAVTSVAEMGRSEESTRLAKGTARPSGAERRAWLERLPLPAARAQPMPALQQIIARGLSSGLPASQVRPVDPFEPGGCCGGVPRSQAYRFGSDFNSTTMAPPLLAYSVATSIINLAANDILIWKSAEKLRKNMECAGIRKTRNWCCDTHHIVHRSGYDKGAVAASKAILAAAGIGIDDWENGVHLDCIKHKSTQNDAYDRNVANKLGALTTINRATVTSVLRQIAAELAAGGAGC